MLLAVRAVWRVAAMCTPLDMAVVQDWDSEVSLTFMLVSAPTSISGVGCISVMVLSWDMSL